MSKRGSSSGWDDEVREAGGARVGLHRHGPGGRDEGARGRRIDYARYSTRTSDTCTASRRPGSVRSTSWTDRDPDRQRQQQLLHRIHRALPRDPGGPQRSGRLRTRARLREDADGFARHDVRRPGTADDAAPSRSPNCRSSRCRPRRTCSVPPARSTWSATAPPRSSSRGSASRTTGTRRTIRTRSSRTSTRSRTCWPPSRSPVRSPSSSARRRRTGPGP